MFPNATFTGAHNPRCKKLRFCGRHPRYWGEEGNQPKDWVRKKRNLYLQKFPKLSLKSRSHLARLTLPSSLLATHIYRDPFITRPGNVAARSNLKITVKASPARRQIPVLTAPGIKAKNRGSTWLKGCGSEKWASSLDVSSRLAGRRCIVRGEPIRARLTLCEGREQPSPGSWDSIRSHTGWGT